jgi:alpha-beta hydrolase superfamily lysophospholipase
MPNNKSPAFFNKLNHFIDAIPQLEPQDSSKRLININSANQKTIAHLKNYLDFYNIDFINGCDADKNIASTHKIWQSQIFGYRIIEQCWQAKSPNGKTLFIVHGYFEHIGLYKNIIFWSLKHGYKVHLFDLPGHGLSSGKAADIDSFTTYSNILTSIIRRENAPTYSLIGQSTGGAIIINALLSNVNTEQKIIPENIILLSPLVRSLHWQQLRWFVYLMHRFTTSIKRYFPMSSHNKNFNEFLEHNDPLQARRIPLSWLGAMNDWNKQIKTHAQNTEQPCWLIQGTGDKTVDYKYNIVAIKRCLPQIQVELITGAAHNLINESDEYWQQVVAKLSTVL